MKRKVVQHGPSSLIVSLPNEWIKKNKIKKGDNLDVNIIGKSILSGLKMSKAILLENLISPNILISYQEKLLQESMRWGMTQLK